MNNELVVKDNALINASYNLELTEQRLVLLAIVIARDSNSYLEDESSIYIHANDYAKQFNTSLSSAYEALVNAAKNLFNRQFSYKEVGENGQIFTVTSRWVSEIAYSKSTAELRLIFPKKVKPLITRLEKNFTTYQMKQVSQLTTKYAIRLYELIISWRETCKVPKISLVDLRHRLGLSDGEYKQMGHFKERILNQSIEQINKFTDITVTYEQYKKGRSIVAISFDFTRKPNLKIGEDQLNLVSGEPSYKLTQKQITLFANKLAYDNAFSAKYAEIGEEYEELETRLSSKLQDEAFVQEIYDYLITLGFNQ